MGPFTSPRGKDRRLEGERMARAPGGLGRPLTTRRQQWRERPLTAFSGSRRERSNPARAGWQAGSQRMAQDRNRRHAGAARQPRGPRQVPEGPLEGPSSRPGRVCWGRRTTGPRVAHAAPAHPSHLPPPRWAARDGRRVRTLLQHFNRDQRMPECLSRRPSHSRVQRHRPGGHALRLDYSGSTLWIAASAVSLELRVRNAQRKRSAHTMPFALDM